MKNCVSIPSLTIQQLLDNASLVIFDSDGVLIEDGHALPFAADFVEMLKSSGKKTVVFTNNSTTDPIKLLELYYNMGILVDKIYTSSILIAKYCQAEGISTAFVVGEDGLKTVLQNAGITVLEDNQSVDAVIVGMDRALTYDKLTKATHYILSGSRFLATNPDKNFPTPRGLEPGAGSMIAALEASTESKVEIIVGKPDPWGFELILKEEGVSHTHALMVGDRFETDIIGAINANIPAFVVNTGVAAGRDNPGSWEDYSEVPVLHSFKDLL